jgi:membrane protease YdiL (CAAX protease family)
MGQPARRPAVPAHVAGAMLGAVVAIAATFRGPRARFWPRMTRTGLGLAAVGLLGSGAARRTRIGPRDVVAGAASGAWLYLVFRAGDPVARRLLPRGDAEIRGLYALGTLRPRGELAARLALVGPAEELFWRGFVQEALAARHGRWRGAVLATVAYAGAHVATGNLVLVGAAGVAGAQWSAMYAAGVPLGTLVVSHAIWDLWIFLLRPTGGGAGMQPAPRIACSGW